MKREKPTGPNKPPFHTPVYVLTHKQRESWERKGGTTFKFTNETINMVLQKAKNDAGRKDVRISGGADVLRQYLNADLIDEFSIHIAPKIPGAGIKLFEELNTDKISVEVSEVVHSPLVTHIFYNVINHNK